MLQVAVLDDYFGRARASVDWQASPVAEFAFFQDHEPDPQVLASRLQDFDGVVLMRERTPFPAELIQALPRLKILITSGMKNPSIDVAAAKARGISVCGTRLNGYPTAELTFMLIMLLVRQALPQINALKQAGTWQAGLGQDLRGKTLGLVGLGRLGGQVSQMAQAFGMKTLAWSENLTQARCQQLGVEQVDKAALFERSDVVSLHLRLSERSAGVVGAAELSRLGPQGYLVNTSRAGLVDRDALLKALEAGGIRGAGLDVFDHEPLAHTDALLQHPRTLCTPHLGYVTQENYAQAYGDALEVLVQFAAGNPINLL